jgi:hypothetical protein
LNEIELPEDKRAHRLFHELELRFSEYIQSLPSSLWDVATSKSTYLGAAAEGEFEGIGSLNPVLAGTPWLFWEQLGELEDTIFLDIAEAGACLVIASILLDHIVDGQAKPAEQTTLFHQSLKGHAFQTYQSVFPSDSVFWKTFFRLERDHIRGLGLEVQAQSTQAQVTWEILEQTAQGKVSPIIGTVAALSFALDRSELLDPIEQSLKHIAVASQLLDDIGDWRHDHEVGHQTYFLSEVRSDLTASAGAADLQSAVDAAWLDVDHLHVVIEQLELSLEVLDELPCAEWHVYVAGYIELAEGHLARAVGSHLKSSVGALVKQVQDQEY